MYHWWTQSCFSEFIVCILKKKKHDDIIKWKHFARYWPFVWGIHRSPVNSPHKGQWCGALMFPLICAWINGWVNNRKAGDLRRNCAHYDISVMCTAIQLECISKAHSTLCTSYQPPPPLGKPFSSLHVNAAVISAHEFWWSCHRNNPIARNGIRGMSHWYHVKQNSKN